MKTILKPVVFETRFTKRPKKVSRQIPASADDDPLLALVIKKWVTWLELIIASPKNEINHYL